MSPRIQPLAFRLAAVLFLAGPAAAQSAPQPVPTEKQQVAITDSRTFGDWGVRCFAGMLPPCEMFQAAKNKVGAEVMGFAIAYLPRRDSYALRLTLPLGVSFAKGVRLSASGYASQPMPYLRCDSAGCYVRGTIERGALDALGRSAPQAKVIVGTAAGRNADMPLSLRGFADARSAMESLARGKSDEAPVASARRNPTAPAATHK